MLKERLIGLGEELGVMERVKEGVRDWSWMIGVRREENEEDFISRVLMGCSLNFNYVEGGIEGLRSEVLWDWVRSGMEREELRKFNLVEKRLECYDSCKWFIFRLMFDIYSGRDLKEWIKLEVFWKELSKIYGSDIVDKRVNLVRMILKESGFEIWDMDKKEIVVDYNLMGVMKYLGVVDYKGNFEDSKEEVDKIRVEVYKVMEELLEGDDKDESWWDGLLFFIGRELRKRGLVDVCLYKGCTDY